MGKRVVRNGCFETNSSSMHSIIVTKDDRHVKLDTYDYRKDEEPGVEYLYIHDGEYYLRNLENEFGRWPFELLTTFEDKLKYALCEFLGHYYGDEPEYEEDAKKFDEIMKELVPEFNGFDIHTKYLDIYVDEDGNEILHRNLTYEGYDYDRKKEEYSYMDSNGKRKMARLSDEEYEVPAIGMIDHQSMGLLKNFLKDNDISLKEFLTNKKYVIVIDGDEYCTFDKYKKSGLINTDFIVSEYDQSGEDIEYQEWLKEQEENEEDN